MFFFFFFFFFCSAYCCNTEGLWRWSISRSGVRTWFCSCWKKKSQTEPSWLFFLSSGVFFCNFIYLFIFGSAESSLLGCVFFSYNKWGLLSSCGVQASQFCGFSCGVQALGALYLQLPGSREQAQQSLHVVAPQHVGSSQIRDWTCVRSGIELVSPALAGRFFTTEPPGKPPSGILFTCVATDLLLPPPPHPRSVAKKRTWGWSHQLVPHPKSS